MCWRCRPRNCGLEDVEIQVGGFFSHDDIIFYPNKYRQYPNIEYEMLEILESDAVRQ